MIEERVAFMLPVPLDWRNATGRRLAPLPLRQQRRRRRRQGTQRAEARGHILTQWFPAVEMEGGRDGRTFMRACCVCGRTLYTCIHPYWVSVDGEAEEASLGLADAEDCDYRPTLFDAPVDRGRFPLRGRTVREAIGNLPAPMMGVGRGKKQRLVVYEHEHRFDPATLLCRGCGLHQETGEIV